MPTATHTDNNSISLTSSGLDSDEFVPLVSFIYDGLKILDASAEIFEYENETIAYNKEEDSELSKHINSYPHASGYKIYERTTKKEKVTFPLYITKGNKESDDDDGVVTVRLSEEIEGVTIKSKEEFKVKYDTDYTLELELKCKEGNIFYVDFYAKDDDDDDWEIGGYTVNDKTGKLKNIHCGRIKIIKEATCICDDADWPALYNMVLEIDKVRYSSKTIIPWLPDGTERECYHYALHQLRVLGYTLISERWNKKWDGTKELNDDIFQLKLDSDVAGMKKGPQKEMFKKSLTYLKQAMQLKTPVMVGLNYKEGYANDDLTTDHFGVITGSGRDKDGRLFFNVTDNYYSSQKFYCKCDVFGIKSADGRMEISQIRKSKKY